MPPIFPFMANPQTPNYDYSDGLNSCIRTFHDGTLIDSTDEHVPPGQLHMLGGSQESGAVLQRVAKDLETFDTVPVPGGQLEYAIVNKGNDSLTIVSPGWGGSFRNPLSVREMAALVMRNPDTTFLALHNPGNDNSSRLPKAMSREMARTGIFLPAGRYLLDALQRAPLQDHRTLDLIGHFQGARYAIGMAAAGASIPIHELRVSDPVGSKEKRFLKFVKTFMTVEGAHSAKYVQASRDAVSQTLQQKGDSTLGLLRKMGGIIVGGGFFDMLRQIDALRRAGLESDLLAAVSTVRERILVTSPELSALTDPDAVEEILKKASAQASNQSLLIQQRLVRGRSHAYHAANPGVYAASLSSPKGKK